MGILAGCPGCHTKQATKNKKCKCGANLDRAKKQQKVRYWIKFRLPDGKQRTESIAAFEDLNPYSIHPFLIVLTLADLSLLLFLGDSFFAYSLH